MVKLIYNNITSTKCQDICNVHITKGGIWLFQQKSTFVKSCIHTVKKNKQVLLLSYHSKKQEVTFYRIFLFMENTFLHAFVYSAVHKTTISSVKLASYSTYNMHMWLQG